MWIVSPFSPWKFKQNTELVQELDKIILKLSILIIVLLRMKLWPTQANPQLPANATSRIQKQCTGFVNISMCLCISFSFQYTRKNSRFRRYCLAPEHAISSEAALSTFNITCAETTAEVLVYSNRNLILYSFAKFDPVFLEAKWL